VFSVRAIGAGGVEQVVVTEVEAVDDGERRFRSVHLSHRHGAVQGHGRARGQQQEMVV
jgi:hypothetical protein